MKLTISLFTAKYRYFCFLLFCISQCFCAQAAIYKSKDPQGKTIYSDQPLPDGEVLELKKLPTYTPAPVPQIDSYNANTGAPAENNYQLQILEPINDQTFPSEVQQITVRLGLMPELKEGDSIRLMLNNQPYGTNEKTLNFTFNQLPRGSYQLQAQIVTADGTVKAKSETLTFYQQRASSNRSNANLAPRVPQDQPAPTK